MECVGVGAEWVGGCEMLEWKEGYRNEWGSAMEWSREGQMEWAGGKFHGWIGNGMDVGKGYGLG
jgi:hypothetical protein